ncbi:MAG: DUF1847 domain-containing protein [Deltaproteobacteria bacterium]|nr:MAG: DUF1847 domain-containing protein [Deltaproteobacteria bacterium]
MSTELPECARCHFSTQNRLCQKEDGKSPAYCPTQNYREAIGQALDELRNPDILEFAKQASIQEGEGYAHRELGYERVKPVKPRVLETIEFAHRMNYKRLGFVFCIGLTKEAEVVEKLLSAEEFEVVSALCKLGREPKETLGVRDDQKIRIGCFESMCNPIAQAFVMNSANTEFNIVMGLCVGHDSLFLKYSDAPCTVLAAKDRVLGHNPLAAIYTIDSYYRYLK